MSFNLSKRKNKMEFGTSSFKKKNYDAGKSNVVLAMCVFSFSLENDCNKYLLQNISTSSQQLITFAVSVATFLPPATVVVRTY